MITITSERWLVGGGEMGALIRALDWSRSPVGPIDSWPQSLRTALGICLSSRFPMAIWWGPEIVQFYNDGYRPFLGAKHPRSMGQPGDEGSNDRRQLGGAVPRAWIRCRCDRSSAKRGSQLAQIRR